MTRYVTTAIAVLALAGCGGCPASAPETDDQAQAAAQEPAETAGDDQPEDTLAGGLGQLAEGLQQLTGGNSADTDLVPFEELMAVLTEADGWTRSNHGGRELTLGVKHSTAEARYEKDGVSVDVTVIDTALSQILIAPYSMFLASGFEERSSDGFTRSMTYEGSPGFESWRAESRNAEMVLLVEDRFIVTGKSTDAPSIDPVREVVGNAVNLNGLAAKR